MSGFWTSFNQIFYTMPEYIRDFTETRPMIEMFEGSSARATQTIPTSDVASYVATINEEERAEIVSQVTPGDRRTGLTTTDVLESTSHELLLHSKVRITPDALKAMIEARRRRRRGITDRIMIARDRSTPSTSSTSTRGPSSCSRC